MSHPFLIGLGLVREFEAEEIQTINTRCVCGRSFKQVERIQNSVCEICYEEAIAFDENDGISSSDLIGAYYD